MNDKSTESDMSQPVYMHFLQLNIYFSVMKLQLQYKIVECFIHCKENKYTQVDVKLLSLLK